MTVEGSLIAALGRFTAGINGIGDLGECDRQRLLELAAELRRACAAFLSPHPTTESP